jgi:hypothetical protein
MSVLTLLSDQDKDVALNEAARVLDIDGILYLVAWDGSDLTRRRS